MLGPSNSIRRNWFALAFAVPWFLLASIRVFALDRVFPLVSIVAFSPLILAAVVIPLAIALLLRARYIAIAVAVFAVVLALLVLPRSVSQSQPNANGRVVTLMTANLLAGSAATDGIERIVAENDVDVLAMQEVTPIAFKVLRDRGLTQELPYFTRTTAPGVAGNVIVSRQRIRERDFGRDPNLSVWPEVIVPSLGLIVRSVHPYPPIKPRQTGIWQDDLRNLPAARPAPGDNLRVLLGDFNATLDHRLLRQLVARDYVDAARVTGNGLKPTWSANRLMKLTIDHVLLDSRIEVESYKTFDLPRSDHDAVVVRVRLPR
ncbi:MAG: endonuclease/exonuclease/phosphatase family protein [Solirubrobacterales bacterium]